MIPILGEEGHKSIGGVGVEQPRAGAGGAEEVESWCDAAKDKAWADRAFVVGVAIDQRGCKVRVHRRVSPKKVSTSSKRLDNTSLLSVHSETNHRATTILPGVSSKGLGTSGRGAVVSRSLVFCSLACLHSRSHSR